jgi:hypothetical protein
VQRWFEENLGRYGTVDEPIRNGRRVKPQPRPRTTSGRHRDFLRTGPFLAWFEAEMAKLPPFDPHFPKEHPQRLVRLRMGWVDHTGADRDMFNRRLLRWREQGRGDRLEIERALDHAGADIGEWYPEYHRGPVVLEENRYCATCREVVTTDESLICPWCETLTVNSTVCPECGGRKSGPSRVCAACTPRDEGGHVASTREDSDVCPGCGGPKTRHARMCWSCYVANGSHTGRKVRKGRALRHLDEETLLEARQLYDGGLSMRQVARVILPRTTYLSQRSAASSLFEIFKRRGWKLRDRVAAIVQSNIDRGFRPQCKHVHGAGRRKGQRCERGSIGEDGYCGKHKPEVIARGIARLRGGER